MIIKPLDNALDHEIHEYLEEDKEKDPDPFSTLAQRPPLPKHRHHRRWPIHHGTVLTTLLFLLVGAYVYWQRSYLLTNSTLVDDWFDDLLDDLFGDSNSNSNTNTNTDTSTGIIAQGNLHFSLKHIYHHDTRRKHADHLRLDLTPEMSARLMQMDASSFSALDNEEDKSHRLNPNRPFHLKAKPKTIRRLSNRTPDFVESYLSFARSQPKLGKTMDFEWSDDLVLVPDLKDKETVVTLAYMSANAYVDIPYTGDWTNVSSPWDELGKDNGAGFGWSSDGVRGHVFVDDSEKIAIIAIKGTSAAIFDSGGDTAPNDKINDNLLFSCCCARISYLWNTVCDCYTGDSYTCDQECVEEQLYEEDKYYRAVLDIYRNVTAVYPESQIWVTGHSLGGSLSALLGRTYGVPAVGFEAPGELLASKRLHLPSPPGVPLWDDHIWHVGHTADPVYMGVCNGAGSACWVGGYAMETQCHSGLQCVYDVVDDKGWHVSLVNHRIHVVIDDVLEAYDEVAECIVPPPCTDCYNWKFIVKEKEKQPRHSTTTATPNPEPTLPTPTPTGDKCVRRAWYGKCLEYGPGVF